MQAGAKKVYAVEASAMADFAKLLASTNAGEPLLVRPCLALPSSMNTDTTMPIHGEAEGNSDCSHKLYTNICTHMFGGK